MSGQSVQPIRRMGFGTIQPRELLPDGIICRMINGESRPCGPGAYANLPSWSFLPGVLGVMPGEMPPVPADVYLERLSSPATRLLTFMESTVLLRRNPALGKRVTQFIWEVRELGYDRSRVSAEEFMGIYEIPPWGITFRDPDFGIVLISPDASGQLHYVAGISEGLKREVDRAPFYSDPNYLLGLLDNLRGTLTGGILPVAGLVLAGLALFAILK